MHQNSEDNPKLVWNGKAGRPAPYSVHLRCAGWPPRGKGTFMSLLLGILQPPIGFLESVPAV